MDISPNTARKSIVTQLAAEAFFDTYKGFRIVIESQGLSGILHSAGQSDTSRGVIVATLLQSPTRKDESTLTYHSAEQFVCYRNLYLPLEWVMAGSNPE